MEDSSMESTNPQDQYLVRVEGFLERLLESANEREQICLEKELGSTQVRLLL